MASTFDKVMDTAGRVAAGAAKATGILVNKGYDKVNQATLQAKLAKLHRQLGALVYALEKNGEENKPMISWYVSEIDKVKSKLAAIENQKESAESDFHTFSSPKAGGEDEQDAMFRGDDEQ